jgi:uncharacterized membrane protein
MKLPLISFFITLTLMVLLDFIWLGIMLNKLYVPKLGHLLGQKLHIIPSILFYLLYAMALNILVVGPALQNEPGYLHTLLLGMVFGLAAYGAYDLTNQAILKDWPTIVTVIDMTWGALLTGVVSVLATYLSAYFK